MVKLKLISTILIIMCITVQLAYAQDSKRSLVVVFDVTASMSDEIDALRDGVKLLLQSFTSRPDNPISEYVFVQFRDEDFHPQKLPIIIESDVNKIYKVLDTFGITGPNYDCPESAYRGIKYGLDAARDNSIMFVFTDAGTKHKELKPELEKLIQRKKIAVYFFLTEGCGREDHEIRYYHDLADSSNGLVFDVDYKQIREHFPKYREVINDKLGLNSVFKGPAGKSKVPVIVDSSMKEFTFTIVAQKPLITIYDPNNVRINNYTILTDLSTIKMLKVLEPIPGQWTVQVEAASPYSGQVSVISDLSFKYGFAVHEPDAITQTSFSPMIGQNNYLAILPSDPKLIGLLEHVVLDTKSGAHNYPLRKKTGIDGDLYVTESLKLPNVPFKVVLHGIDPLNHAIKRLLSPDIASRNPDKPETGIIPKLKVAEGLPIYLVCRVDSMVPITITWWKVGQSSALKSLTSKQSNVLNYTIAESDISDNGDYMCVAENSAGRSESRTVVDVRRTILNVNAPIKQHTPKVGTGSLVLKCVVTPKIASVKISWLFNGGSVLPRGSSLNLPNLVLNNIDRRANGTYTCLAQRNTEIMQDNIEVNVQYPAKILNMFNLNPYSIIDISKPIEIFDQSEIKIMCGHEGNPTPDVKWINQNGVIVSYTSVLVVNGNDITQDGDYVCQTENLAGKDEERINVDISIKPKLLMPFETNYPVQLNDQFSLECPLEIVPQNKIEIFWYHNGSRIQDSLILNDRVKIDKLDHAHNGKYKCRASNKAGAVEAQFNVDVHYSAKILNIFNLNPNTILDISKPIEIFDSSEMKILCGLEGNPKPDVKWINQKGVVVSDTSVLTINGNDIMQSGDYLCQTENLVGKDEKRISVNITIKPKILMPFETNYRVRLSEKFTLECPIQIVPHNKIEIFWFHNESRIHHSLIVHDRLKIDKLDHAHNGKYKCRASNKAGAVEAQFNVDVHYSTKILNIFNLNPYSILDVSKPIEIFDSSEMKILCGIEGNPKPDVKWINQKGVVLSDTSVLTINGNDIMQSGDYLCQTDNLVGKDEKRISVNIIIKPKLLMSFETNYRVRQSEKFSLECPIQIVPHNKIEIFWFHNGSRIHHSLIVHDRLKIDKVDHVHNGKYKCRASNKAGTVETQFNVDVLYEASILKIVKLDDTGSGILDPSVTSLDIYNTTAFSLTCIVNGNPPPVTSWKKNGVIISNTNKLTIDPSATGFSAIYECSTENGLNSDEWVISLVEIIKPKLIRYAILQNLIEDKEFHMFCPIESGDYNVTWYFNGNNFDSHKQADGSLLIDKVRPDMKGLAYCVATNKAGSAVASFNFDVLRAPYGLSVTTSSYKNPIQQIAPNLKQIAVIKNEPLDMTCNGLGNPTPDIYWLKNNRMYSSDKSFDILSVEPKDDATYTCVAENTLGKQMEKIVLVVYVPPFLLNSTGLENSTNTNNANKLGVTVLNRVPVPTTYFRANYQRFVNVTEGEKVVLDCQMNGKPKPKVNWFKNNENLNKESAILEITNAKVENSGIYKCFGDNGRGKMIVIFYLSVHKPISIVTATSTKAVYNIGEEIKLTCKTTGNQLPIIVWRGKGDAVDNENIFKSHDDNIRKQLLQQDEPIYLNGKKIIKQSDINLLERYGKLSYEFLGGEYIGTLEYVIKSARFDNAGDYTCVSRIFKVKKLRVEKFVTIKVVKAPYVENAETVYSILQGIESHKIKCPIQALPHPTFEWYHGTSVITSNQNLDVQNHFLEFKSPTMDQAGDYSCHGTNDGGTAEFKFKVNIFNHIADITNIVLNRSRKTKIQVEKNQTKVLECSIKVEPTYWSQIIDAYPNKKRELLVAQPTYNFYADVSKDIMCSKDADPQYGEIFQITVLEKPIIQTTESIVEVKLDDVLRLQCETTGEPKPTIKWYKYVKEQRYDISNFPEFQTNGEILIKRRAENSDTTMYVCIAQNSLGKDSQVFNVTVLNDSHYFAPWSEWSPCSRTCGEGVQFKTRDCVHPTCDQPRQREERNCTTIKCPVHGGWSEYSKFGQCSKSCVIDLADVAIKEARRQCNNPTPAYGGRNCIGLSVRTINCTVPLCESILTEAKLDYSACSGQEVCCPAGFVYDAKTGGCPEIDKCKRKGPYTVCRASEKCQNIGVDDYECICRPGYRQKNRPRPSNKPNKNPKCYDINECKAEPNPCDTTKRCLNSMGSFSCV